MKRNLLVSRLCPRKVAGATSTSPLRLVSVNASLGLLLEIPWRARRCIEMLFAYSVSPRLKPSTNSDEVSGTTHDVPHRLGRVHRGQEPSLRFRFLPGFLGVVGGE